MAQEEKTVLLNVEVSNKIEESLSKVVELTKQIQELKFEQQYLKEEFEKGNLSFQEYNKETVRLNAGIKSLKSLQKDATKIVEGQYKAYDNLGSTMNEMSKRLSQLKNVYRDLSEEERNSDVGKQIQQQAAELNNKLLDLEKSYGQYGRQVGNYEIVNKSLRGELKEILNTLAEMQLAGETTSEKYEDLCQKANDLKIAIARANETVDDHSFNLAAAGDALETVIASYSAYKSVAQAVGIENETLEQTVQKLQVAQMALNAVKVIEDNIRKSSKLSMIAENLQKSLLIKNTAVETATIGANTLAQQLNTAVTMKASLATKAVTVAQLLWNAALKANPIVAILSLIAALIAGIIALAKWLFSSSDGQEELNASQERWNKIQEESAEKMEKLEKKQQAALHTQEFEQRRLILAMKERGATDEEISEQQFKNEQEKLRLTIANLEATLKANKEKLKAMAAEQMLLLQQRDQLKEHSKGWNELNQKAAEYGKQIKALVKDINSTTYNLNDKKFTLAENEIDHKQSKQKNSSSSGESASEKQYKKDKKLLEQRQKLEQKRLELEKSQTESNFANDLSLADKEFKLKQEQEQKKIDLELKYKKISIDEAKDRQELLAKDEQIYQANRRKKLQDALQKELSTLKQSDEEQIAQIQQANKKKIEEYTAMVEEEYGSLLTASTDDIAENSEAQNLIAEYSLRIYQQEQEQIAKIQKESLANRMKQEEELINKKYSGDLQKYSQNELLKTQTEIKQLQERAEKRKEIYGQDEEYNKLLQEIQDKQAQERKLQLDNDLLLTLETNKQKYEAQKQYYLNEMELASDNQAKRKELENELFNLEQEHRNQRLEAFQSYTSQISSISAEVNNMLKAREEAQTSQLEEENTKRQEALQKRLDAGVISQEEYDKQVALSEQKLDKEKAKIVRNQAVRERIMKLFEIASNTAAGIMQAFAQTGPIAGIPLAAMVASTGALQTATVMAQPLPKAATGGIIKGKRHAQGGEIIEAEDGEIIINRKSSKKYQDVLQAINSDTVASFSSVPNYDFLSTSSQNQNLAFGDLKNSIEQMKIFVAVEDINRGQKNYANIQSNGNF